jgi:hypothetical protein
VTGGEGWAQTGALNSDPADVVKKYLSLDMKGARLESLSRESLLPYIDWRDEPAWGRVVVTEDYTVITDIKQWEVISLMDVWIPVKVRVVGSVYWETASFLPEPKEEEIRFRVKAVVGRWRIAEPMLPPHVGRKRMMNFVRQAILEERDPVKQARLAELENELRSVRP